jgi:very-short-patch-repair endonuclease
MPSKRTSPKGYERARQLRKEMTPAEKKLWTYLRGNKINGVKFRRQHAVGSYILDFCAIQKKLILELDGSQHLDQEEYDEERTIFLNAQGYRVLRFWNSQVMDDIENVIKEITYTLESSTTS